jgi:hypothetical protein
MSAADAFCVTKGRGLPRAGHHQAEQADQMERGCHMNLVPAERESKGSALVQAAVAARQF